MAGMTKAELSDLRHIAFSPRTAYPHTARERTRFARLITVGYVVRTEEGMYQATDTGWLVAIASSFGKREVAALRNVAACGEEGWLRRAGVVSEALGELEYRGCVSPGYERDNVYSWVLTDKGRAVLEILDEREAE